MSRPRTVLFLINSMALGGAERQMAELVRRLPRDRYRPSLCLLDPENAYADLLPADLDMHVIGRVGPAAAAVGIRRLIRDLRPDIVHSFMERANLFNRLLSPLDRVPVVISSVRSRMMAPRYRLVERLLAARCDAVVVNSVGTRDELIRWQRVPESKVRVIGNIVDFDRFRPPDPAERREARRLLGCGDGPVFAVPGRISIAKHQAGLVAAVARASTRGGLPPGALFLLAGRVYDGSIAAVLPRLMRAFGVAGRFRLTGGLADVRKLYAAADWVVLPSLYEGLPNAALEAHACGLPLLMSRSANLDRVMLPGQSGFEFATGWPGPLAGAIVRAASLPEGEARRMGQTGRTHVLAAFDPGAALGAVLDLYEELLAAGGRGRA